MSEQPLAQDEIDRKRFVGDADVLAALGVTVEELAAHNAHVDGAPAPRPQAGSSERAGGAAP